VILGPYDKDLDQAPFINFNQHSGTTVAREKNPASQLARFRAWHAKQSFTFFPFRALPDSISVLSLPFFVLVPWQNINNFFLAAKSSMWQIGSPSVAL
jgi:hypothetical protein